ncbi:MAG: twin-arginine translocase TatA/TatE family subunit [Rhizobiales bacterium]|jgi:sec-independent protein translocase protein TatA|nr:twin-arginine translocase TatA/TatE family subunit [Hyphomicrobiales bacterium]
MGGLSIWHWLVVAVVVLLLFGRGKISELMGDAAKGIKAFKKGMADDEPTAASTTPPKTIDQTPPVVRRTDDQKVG